MDINDKLKYYKKIANRDSEPEALATIPAHLKALEEHFSGQILYKEAPVLHISRSVDGSVFSHTEVNLKLLSLNQISKPVPREECVFFDLETTGLAGGAGTFAFLIGFAWWEGQSIKSRQYFLPDFGREPLLFEELREWLARFNYIVSYNGKSYDLPLLNNRFILNRVQNGFSRMEHIDLIHLCRRLFKDSFSSCSLQSMEARLLGVVRQNDIPGAFIPQAYFDFVRFGIVHDVIRIIEHNYRDIVSLAMIMDSLHFLSGKPFKLPLDEAALVRLARLASEAGDTAFLDDLEEKGADKNLFSEAYYFWKSLGLKRALRWQEAVKLWQKLSASREFHLPALEELAKYFEHVKKDLNQALSASRRALDMLELEQDLGRMDEIKQEWQERFEKRQLRLTERLQRRKL